MNKKFLLGFGAALASLTGILWLKKNNPLEPKIPVVDDGTVLLFQYTSSPFCLKVAKIMDYKGIPYKTVDLIPMVHSGFVKKISGQGLVPVIKHKGKVINDSTLIAKYLDEISPNSPLYFSDEELNNQALLMEDWGDESFEKPLAILAVMYMCEHPEIVLEDSSISSGIEFLDNNKEKVVPVIAGKMLKKQGITLEQKDSFKKRAREYLNILSTKIENKQYLVGDRLSIADITIASHLSIAEKVPYIYEDEQYAKVFAWQKEIFKQTKRRQTSMIK